jgi:hypothetical protein
MVVPVHKTTFLSWKQQDHLIMSKVVNTVSTGFVFSIGTECFGFGAFQLAVSGLFC